MIAHIKVTTSPQRRAITSTLLPQFRMSSSGVENGKPLGVGTKPKNFTCSSAGIAIQPMHVHLRPVQEQMADGKPPPFSGPLDFAPCRRPKSEQIQGKGLQKFLHSPMVPGGAHHFLVSPTTAHASKSIPLSSHLIHLIRSQSWELAVRNQ